MSYYVQLPPDGVGKKIRHSQQVDILVQNELIVVEVGISVSGKTSGANGLVVGVSREDGWTTIHVKNSTGTFAQGEELTNGATVTYGIITTVIDDLFSPVVHIADRNQPSNTLSVSDDGAAFVTFPEGTPQFDAFGRMQVSELHTVMDYSSVIRDEPGKYFSDSSGSGIIEHVPSLSVTKFSVDVDSGAKSYRTTNQYHPYKPGISQLVYMTVASGDAGKTGVIREWGYFDSLDGVGFRLNGITLEVFIRTSVGGSVSETVIPQENWNANKLLAGVGVDFVLDTTKGNVYWIDFEWLGMGRVRFGVIAPDGSRITCHVMENANNNAYPYMQTGSLPLTWGIKNTQLTSSPSELRMTCATVFTETYDVTYTGRLIHISPSDPISLTDSSIYKPFLQFKAKSLVNGLPNRIVGMHETFDWVSIGDTPIHVAIFVLPSETYLSGVKWSEDIVPSTMLYVDTDTTSFPQYEIWNGASSVISGSITGTVLTVTGIVSGTLRKDQYIVGDGILPNTKITGYITGSGGNGTYTISRTQNIGSISISSYEPLKPIESFIAPANSADRASLGDRIEKSFGLGGNLNVSESNKAVFVFAARPLKKDSTAELFYTKYWKEVK